MNQEHEHECCQQHKTKSTLPEDAVKFEGCRCHKISDAQRLATINTTTKKITINREALASLNK